MGLLGLTARPSSPSLHKVCYPSLTMPPSPRLTRRLSLGVHVVSTSVSADVLRREFVLVGPVRPLAGSGMRKGGTGGGWGQPHLLPPCRLSAIARSLPFSSLLSIKLPRFSTTNQPFRVAFSPSNQWCKGALVGEGLLIAALLADDEKM